MNTMWSKRLGGMSENYPQLELNLELTAALQDMQAKVDAGKSRIQELWNMNCSQLVAFDSTLSAKDAEIKRLASRIAELERKERSS